MRTTRTGKAGSSFVGGEPPPLGQRIRTRSPKVELLEPLFVTQDRRPEPASKTSYSASSSLMKLQGRLGWRTTESLPRKCVVVASDLAAVSAWDSMTTSLCMLDVAVDRRLDGKRLGRRGMYLSEGGSAGFASDRIHLTDR